MSESVRGASAPRHVMFAVACYDWKVHVHFMDSMLATQIECIAAGIRPTITANLGLCHVDSAYNSLIADFLESDCTDLVTLGSDQGWRAKDMVTLLGYDRDIVAGAYPKKQNDEAYTVLLDTKEIHADADGLVEAYTVGTGFLRLKRHVVETLAANAPKYMEQGREVPWILERKIINGEIWSGDNVLCLKAKEAGFKIYVDPEMHFEHVGNQIWKGCLGDYWRRVNNLEQPNE